MFRKRLLSLFSALLVCLSAQGQFYTTGDDPGGLKWYTISSRNFKIIYPQGLDSLARVYGGLLEQYRAPVGASIGFMPNECYRKPMPVVLHAYKADANGVVTWAPRRMELYTGKDARRPDVLDWETTLALHESRHVAQMQFARGPGYKWTYWLCGDLFAGGMGGLYPGKVLFEGDAVVMETALSRSGRGRSADFLEYYRASFDEGDFRDWYTWRWGSQKYYAPDHYALGYMLVGGVRSTFDSPLFAKDYYDRLHRKNQLPLPFLVKKKTVYQESGLKYRDAWKIICDLQQAEWKTDEDARGPFTEAVRFTPDTRRFTEYLSPIKAGEDFVALRHSLASSARLVRIDTTGKVESLRPFSSSVTDIQYSEPLGKLFWSEIIPDIRWAMASTAQVFSSDPDGKHAKALNREGRWFNPAPSPTDGRVAVSEYPAKGGTAVLVIDGQTGEVLEHYPAPDTLQVVETAWMPDGGIAASGISPSGFGIYSVTGGFETLLAPQPAKIKQLRTSGANLYFVSDRSGVNELYTLDGDNVIRLSNNRLGASEFVFSGDSLVFAALNTKGRQLYKNAVEPVAVDYGELHSYLVADKLSAQEKALGAVSEVSTFSEPERYRKSMHLMRFHSWAPLFIDYDSVSDLSMETITSLAGIGATAFFQNDLGTSYGSLAWSYPHGAHLKFTYTGLYPIIELSAKVGERERNSYVCSTKIYNSGKSTSISKEDGYGGLGIQGTAKVYVPLNFSSGGWTRGVIPQISASFSNDRFNSTNVIYKCYDALMDGEKKVIAFFSGAEKGPVVPLGRVTASLRAYTTTSTAASGIYPRWGFGAEAGYSGRPGDNSMFTPNAYTLVYGYLPGLMDTHSIKFSVTNQFQQPGKLVESHIIVLPRGFANTSESLSELQSYIALRYPVQNKVAVDYIFPLLPIDHPGLRMLEVFRNFEAAVHYDCGWYGGSESFDRTGMFSAGLDLCTVLRLPLSPKVGVSYNYNGGVLWNTMTAGGLDLGGHHGFSLILSVDI
ncbi:MAG: hypothetical protein Q4G10_04950 [Bacteroidia bacterium]|nr:hypothetical protein [Bacteroidia bacterium]